MLSESKDKSIYNEYRKKNKTESAFEEYNCFSYGRRKGKYNLREEEIIKICLDKELQKEYALVEKKRENYTLIYDLDYKEKDFKGYKDNKIEDITNRIIKEIKETIKETIKEGDDKYVYAVSTKGRGVHIYFPEIVINKEIHKYMTEELIRRCKGIDKKIDKIIDKSISNANGLRLFYCYKDGRYYYPVEEKSTYNFSKNPKEHFKICLINREETNVELKKEIKEEKKKIKTKIREYEEDKNKIELGEDRIEFMDLMKIVSKERLERYEEWIKIVFLYRTYGLKEEILKISDGTNKTEEIINQIFSKPLVKNPLTIRTLKMWAKKDNKEEYEKIKEREGYAKYVRTSGDIYKKGIKKIDYKESERYITKEAVDKFKETKKKIIIIESPTGSGKTTIIKELIKGKKKILSVVSRRSMISCHKDAFGFDSYLDGEPNKDKYIISLENLGKKEKEELNYEMIIFDEFNSLVNHFYSTTMNKVRPEAFTNILYLISKAKKVICCDAMISDMCYSLLDIIGVEYFTYKNEYKNKEGVKMNIKYGKEGDETEKLVEYCNNISKGIKGSTLILSDSKSITEKVYIILKEHLSKDKKYLLINKDTNDYEDLENCNEKFENKCVIASPTITYGIDILIKYDKIYCIYKNTAKINAMTALEYHQQYSRARNCKEIDILILNPNQKGIKNYYIKYDKHRDMETREYENYKSKHKEGIEKHGMVDELCKKIEIDGNITIDKSAIFSEIHYLRTWYDKITSANKVEIIKLLAEEVGYEITESDFIIENKVENLKKIKESVKEYGLGIKEIRDNIIEDEEYEVEDIDKKVISKNIKEEIKKKKEYLEKDRLDKDKIKELLESEVMFRTYINKKYLDFSKENYEKFKLKLGNKEIGNFVQSNKLLKSIDLLYEIEDKLKINRYEIENINLKEEEIGKFKEWIIDSDKKYNKDKYLYKMAGIECENNQKRNIKILEDKVNKIETNEDIKELMVVVYNKFGKIFNKKRKQKQKNKVIEYYYEYDLIEEQNDRYKMSVEEIMRSRFS